MRYQYVREPLTADESDRLSNACETTIERLIVWTLLDTGLHVGELCALRGYPVITRRRNLLLSQEVRTTHRRRSMPRCVSRTTPT